MAAIDVIDAERSERAPLPAAASRDMNPGGLALSAILHIAVLILIILGLPSLFRHKPPEDTPIAVNLVLIAPDTRATHPNPFRPRANAKPLPPIAAPAPKPEPKPEPAKPVPEPPAAAAPPPPSPTPPQPAKPEAKAPPPPPPPPPKPVEARAPPPPPPEKPQPEREVRQEHHAPAAAKEDPAAFDKLLKTLEERRPERTPAKLVKSVEQKRPEPSFDSLLKNLTREQTAEADEAPPAPHHVAATAPPSSQPRAPLGAQLTASVIDLVREKLRPCFNPPFGAKEKPDLVADIQVMMNPDGTVQQAHVADMGQYGSDPVYRAIADAGVRALKNPECSPLPLPPDRFDLWQSFIFGFSTRDMQ